jgi:broad specificity phosphatase PhoE
MTANVPERKATPGEESRSTYQPNTSPVQGREWQCWLEDIAGGGLPGDLHLCWLRGRRGGGEEWTAVRLVSAVWTAVELLSSEPSDTLRREVRLVGASQNRTHACCPDRGTSQGATSYRRLARRASSECGRSNAPYDPESAIVVELAPRDPGEESLLPGAAIPPLPRDCIVPPAVTLAYLARHGQTESNLLRRYAGSSSESLTADGQAQMMALAARLGASGIGEIRTSEVTRARESADLIGRVLGVPVHVDPRLNEIRMGPWEGLTEVEVAARFPEAHSIWQTVPDRLALDGRETLDELAARATAALRDAAQRPAPVLLMTHVAPIRVAVLRALGLSLALYKHVRVYNGACVIVRRPQGVVHRLGESRSLRDELSVAVRDSSVA